MVGAMAQLSVAVADPVLAGNVLAVQATVTFAGQNMAGPDESVNVMTEVQVVELPQSSVAVHVRIMLHCGGVGEKTN